MDQGTAPYQYPPLSLLKEGSGEIGGRPWESSTPTASAFPIPSAPSASTPTSSTWSGGPSVTRYELELDQGVRLNKLTNLADDIALALGATGVRIAPIPDQISMVGIEVPNKLVSPVSIHSVIGSNAFTRQHLQGVLCRGQGHRRTTRLWETSPRLPHLLIAGTTGSGKSVCTNSLIISLLYKATPEEVRLIMVDPKMVELGIYNGIPHLLIPVVTDPKKAAGALQWAVTEMMKRYRTFSEVGVRDLAAYNAKAAKTEGMEKMPQIVVIIDELADLMLVAAKEVEESICRVAQMGRASRDAPDHRHPAPLRRRDHRPDEGQHPQPASPLPWPPAMESRIILDITRGRKSWWAGAICSIAPLGSGKPTRVQGCLITDQRGGCRGGLCQEEQRLCPV